MVKGRATCRLLPAQGREGQKKGFGTLESSGAFRLSGATQGHCWLPPNLLGIVVFKVLPIISTALTPSSEQLYPCYGSEG